ncbi:MAG TPA: YwiC-like family protein [Acidimicrobiales bacterium]|nr:YwiC-like family protein [Acidimicrobiales bacterium]
MTAPPVAGPRAQWRKVAIPSEHGGWGLTLEPVLLGLLLAWSWAGLLLGVAAFLAFLARTPLKVVAVDRRRGRWLPRSRLAARIAAAEIAGVCAVVVVAGLRAGWWWLVPAALAVPFVAVELWFDVRSHSRRLVPEVCGAAGIAAAAPAIVVAGGGGARLAAGAWLVLAARAIGSVPHVRVQIERLHHRSGSTATSDLGQVVAVAFGTGAAVADPALVAGAVGVLMLGAAHAVWIRRPAVAAKILGIREMVLGLALVLVTALGVHL